MNSRIRTAAIAVMIFFIANMYLRAQAALPASQENVTPAPGPDSRADWIVAISTAGGFDGQGRGGFSVTSTGVLACSSPPPCTRQVPKPALQPLESFVNSAALPQPLQMTAFLPPI